MSSAPLILGIDQGTTAVKATLFDSRLTPVRAARRATATTHPHPGWVEKDAEAILVAVTDAVAEVLEHAPGEVVACGLDHEGESVLAWDAGTGRALSPVVVWQDKRGQGVLDALARADGEEVTRRSGLPLDPYFSASKLAWLLDHDAATAAAREAETLRLGTVDAFLTDRLGGTFATDASTASRTMLHALGGDGWDPWLLECFGVPVDTLPEVGDSVGNLGRLAHDSWPGPIPLTARVVDQQAALAGAGCLAPGPVKATYGTGVFVLAVTGDERPRPPAGLLPTVAWRIGGRDTFAVDGGVFAAGAMLDWCCETLGLAPDAPALGELARSVPDSRGARILPALAGLGAPWWQPDARAVIAGVDRGTTRAHLARAALEGIAWRVADVVAALGDLVPVSAVRADGGLTNEPLLLQLQADAAGVPVETAGTDATVAGVAALAALGAGLVDGTDGLAALLPPAARTAPERKDAWRTEEHERWRAFVRGAGALR